MTSHDHVTPEFLPDVVSHSKSDTVIIMTSMHGEDDDHDDDDNDGPWVVPCWVKFSGSRSA